MYYRKIITNSHFFQGAVFLKIYINAEQVTIEETRRLFDALSEGGTVTMPLAAMFWGAYFGTFTDKYGINRMFNYSTL